MNAVLAQTWAKAGARFPSAGESAVDEVQAEKKKIIMRRLRAERSGKDTSQFPPRVKKFKGQGHDPDCPYCVARLLAQRKYQREARARLKKMLRIL